MDGNQPIVGAHVYLFAANTDGYGEASVPLLVSAGTGHADALGGYTLTGQDGSFTIPGGYTCKSTDQIYVYVLGGNAGLGVNSAIGELAVLGACPLTSQTTPPFVWVNEVSTVAAAYATAGFAVDATHVSSSGTKLAQTGIKNAFAAAANLASLSTGTALSTIPSGNASVPQGTINTLANILAACVHSATSGSQTCATFFNSAEAGTLVPTETATATINIAHRPANNVAALYALQTSSSFFSPSLNAAPNDFSLALNFTTVVAGGTNGLAIDSSGSAWLIDGVSSLITLSSSGSLLLGASGYTDGLYGPGFIAIDQSDNVWVTQYEIILSPPSPRSLFEFSNSGLLLSGTNGYLGGLGMDRDIAIDATGDIWVANSVPSSVVKFSNSGSALSGPAGFTGGGMLEPFNIAIDAVGSAWVTNFDNNTVTKLSTSGSILSGATGFTDGIPGASAGIAIDSYGNAWVSYPAANSTLHRVSKFSSTGEVLSGSTGFTGTGVGNGVSLAIDGANNVWIPNTFGNSIAEMSNSGSVLSGPNGFVNTALLQPYTLVTDGSGNVWVSSGDIRGSCNLVEFIGIATPVVTPLSVAVATNSLGSRP